MGGGFRSLGPAPFDLPVISYARETSLPVLAETSGNGRRCWTSGGRPFHPRSAALRQAGPRARISPQASRLARHRKRIATGGAKRVEVTVPLHDAPLVKAIAGALRSGGEDAELIRRSLQPRLTAPRARTGAELVAFFRAAPLTDAELTVERAHSMGRSADLA